MNSLRLTLLLLMPILRGMVTGAKKNKPYEYIVIGAGSAGSIVAGELAKSGYDVLIVEAGGDNLDPNIDKLSQYFSVAFNSWNFGFMHWGYATTAQVMTGAEEPQRKIIELPRGKVLGGTHSMNAAAYVQANADDFNNIAIELGDKMWEWNATADLRSQLESTIGIVQLGDEQEGAEDFIEAAEKVLGFPFNPDPRNGEQFGISPSFWTGRQSEAGGIRRSSFDAFVVKQAMGESSTSELTSTSSSSWSRSSSWSSSSSTSSDDSTNERLGRVDVVTFHHVAHLIFDPKDDSRVIGVSCINTRARDIPAQFFASKEVIVSAGTYNSPQILLRSGIGPIDHLKDMEIVPKHVLPGVGANLRDHYTVATYWNLVELEPDTPFLFQSPILNMFGPEPTGLTKFQIEVSGNYGSCVPLRQDSHGTVRLRSNSWRDPPIIDPNILSTKKDIDDLVECLRDYLLPFFDELVQRQLVSPNSLDPTKYASDEEDEEELRKFVIKNISSNHHPVGTCKVGRDEDPMAVLDQDFKVRGVSNLRVIDASVFPRTPSGNINAPVMTAAMIGAKKIILGDRRRGRHASVRRGQQGRGQVPA